MAVDHNYLSKLSIRFIRAVKGAHGRDKGVEVLNALQPILGKDWAGQVIFDMLSDSHQDTTAIMVDFTKCTKMINAIKSVRWANNNMGLKEAKDFVVDAKDNVKGPVRVPVAHPRREDWETDAMYEKSCETNVEHHLKEFQEIDGVRAWRI